MAEEQVVTAPPGDVPATPAPVETPVVVPVVADKAVSEPQTVPLSRLNQEVAKRRNLEREIEHLQRVSQPPAAPKPSPEPSEPKMQDFGDETDPTAVKRFNEAWVDHRAELKLKQYKQEQQRDLQTQAAETRRAEAARNLQNNILKAASTNPEIYDLVSTFDSYNFHNEFATVVAESEKSAELIGFMAENPAEALRLRNMPLSRSLHELGRIESKLSGNGKPEPKVTKTTAPPTPVDVEHQTIDIGRMSQKEYNAYMNKRMGL